MITPSSGPIGIIPDGTRRWSRRTGVSLPDAYRRTLRSVTDLVAELHALGCAEVTVYCVSKANLGRPREEVDAMCDACDVVPETLGALQRERKLGRVTLVGSTDLVPEMTARLAPLCLAPAGEDGIQLNLLVGYDGWHELREVAAKGMDLLPERLPIARPVDAIIRSAGGSLLSGFLPMQSQYAQLIVDDRLFNDLTSHDLRELARRASDVRHQHGL